MFGVYMFAAVVCISALVQAVPPPGHGGLEGYCNTNDHCKTNECCVKFGKQPKINFVNGTCENFGSRNSDCFMVNNKPRKIYSESCPCGKRLTCVEKRIGKMGICGWPYKG